MKVDSLFVLLSRLLLVLSICLPQVAHAQLSDDDEPPTVAVIKVVGNLRTEAQAIKNQIQHKTGVALNASVIREDTRRIYRMGRFNDVRVEAEQTSKGLLLLFIVKEKPAIRKIRIKGNKEVQEDDIKGVLDVKRYGILNRAQIQKNVKKIKDLYIEKGYYLATVRAEISKLKKASVVVTFRINENAKIHIRQINFVGNKQVPSGTLRRYLQTSEHDLISWVTGRSTYQQALIKRDLFFLQSYYLDNGYVTVKLGDPKVYLGRNKRSMYITYWITEGKTYRYGDIDVAGKLLWKKEKVKSWMTIKKGELFSRSKLYKENILRLTTRYQDRGYAYVNVIPRHKLDHKKQLFHLTMQIQPGPRVRIERIEVTGNSKTQDKVIRREIRVYEGDYYNGSKVQLSQRRVFALGFFEKTHPLYGIKVVSRRGSKPDRIILRFIVKEKSTGTFQVGAGLSTFEGLVFNAQVSQNNLMGRGQTMSLAAQVSGIRQLFQLQFVDPHLLDTDWTFAFSAYNSQRDLSTFFSIGFRQTTTGGTLTWGYPLIDNLNALVTYKFERVFIEPVGITRDSDIRLKGFFSGTDGPTITSSVRATVRYDLRNNRLFPSRGSLNSFSVEFADRLLGSQNRFTRFSLISRWYFSMPLGMVLRFNLNAGLITSTDPRGVPAFERYRLGGINSIRGYGPFSIGPVRKIPSRADGAFSLDDFNWGGNKEFVLNTEIEIPIIPKVGIKGVIFFDAGNAFDDDELFFQDKRNPNLPFGLYLSVGFGVRWFSPIGPLRFEWGIPITPRAGDRPILFEFSIGNAF
ncbi:MAG: outer membrane protein assembly factor BamA [Deltaproteobacteria bacterium]|nr:outer membrane protein assembly factor BamA [Deltaproteobacteria bacterium]MBU50347.1 outer membrane protein assembly factor BamA [Deltaproteobacteria bacterium]